MWGMAELTQRPWSTESKVGTASDLELRIIFVEKPVSCGRVPILGFRVTIIVSPIYYSAFSSLDDTYGGRREPPYQPEEKKNSLRGGQR